MPREIEVALIIFIGITFSTLRVVALYMLLPKAEGSCQYDVIQRWLVGVCLAIIYPKRVERLPSLKFDTWHPTNRLGYRIESYFSRYRCPRDLHSS